LQGQMEEKKKTGDNTLNWAVNAAAAGEHCHG
jgi:hypothetical protein